MAGLMCRQPAKAQLTAIADPRSDTIRSEIPLRENTPPICFYYTADRMLENEDLDGVVVGTRCSLHAPMALKVIAHGIPLFLEKPIATNIGDALSLHETGASKVVVSFPLRLSKLVQLAKGIIESGQIGAVDHVQAWCNVDYASVYFKTWYRDENETQGLFLQKATHDFDYINYLLAPNRPRAIGALVSKQVFKGSHKAGLRCMDCDERGTCFESKYRLTRDSPLPMDNPSSDMCAFAVDTGNEDCGSALIQYQSGMHVSYSQNFFTRGLAAKRGARFIGYHGTLEFDWYANKLSIVDHHSAEVRTHELTDADDHGGGDPELAVNFLEVIRGERPSLSTRGRALERTHVPEG